MYPISKPMIAIISVFLQFTSLLVRHLHNLPSPQQHDPAKSCEKEVKRKTPRFSYETHWKTNSKSLHIHALIMHLSPAFWHEDSLCIHLQHQDSGFPILKYKFSWHSSGLVPGKYPLSRWRAKKSVQNQPLDTVNLLLKLLRSWSSFTWSEFCKHTNPENH